MDQVEEFERQVTNEEIKREVWDCGENKSPGQDDIRLNSFVVIGI